MGESNDGRQGSTGRQGVKIMLVAVADNVDSQKENSIRSSTSSCAHPQAGARGKPPSPAGGVAHPQCSACAGARGNPPSPAEGIAPPSFAGVGYAHTAQRGCTSSCAPRGDQ